MVKSVKSNIIIIHEKDVKSERERETLLELYPAKVVLWKYFLNKVKL